MPTLPEKLIQYLMELFGNEAAAEAFTANPEKELHDRGLGDVCRADVDAVKPVLVDFAPVSFKGDFSRDYNTGHNEVDSDWTGPGKGHDHGGKPGRDDHGHGGKPGGDHGDDDHGAAVQQLVRIVNEYNYTSTVDDRDTILDQSVNQQIWAEGNVQQLFMNEAVIASGDGAMAAGDDLDASTDHSTNVYAGDDAYVGNEDSFHYGSHNTEDSYNKDSYNDFEDSFNSTEDSIVADRGGSIGQVGDDVEVDLDVDVEDSFNKDSFNETDVDIDASTDNSVTADRGGQVGDNSEDNDIVVKDNNVASNNQDNDTSTTTTTTTTNDVDISSSDDDIVVKDNEVLSNNDVLSHNDVLSGNKSYEDNDDFENIGNDYSDNLKVELEESGPGDVIDA